MLVSSIGRVIFSILAEDEVSWVSLGVNSVPMVRIRMKKHVASSMGFLILVFILLDGFWVIMYPMA